ncbi:unnamed protein product [Angiostrongylus costaricensis]|uniref:BTB domain-containing protein n=1 Tax=Angiostrongylus costaricensis TaxID=334426 RepID=A0A0R3PHK6_ANGCS|nr:unnamed protein product [Angiostrongylus costaricensis]
MLHLDPLKAVQRNFTPCGLNIVIEWMYGTRIELSIDKLTDALAAAFALEIYDMVDAIEQAVLTCSKWLHSRTETSHPYLQESAAAIEEISTMAPFLALPSPIFKKIVKKAINSLKRSQRRPFGVIKSIVFWEAENSSNKVAVLLLKQIPLNGLSNVEMNRLYEMAREFGLENLAELILCQYRTLNTSNAVERLFYEERINKAVAFAVERNSVRIAAGKNSTETKQHKGESKFKGAKGISWEPSSQDPQALQKALHNLNERISFGIVPLDKSVNDLHIEVTYKKSTDAAMEEAVKLFFDIEVDSPYPKK